MRKTIQEYQRARVLSFDCSFYDGNSYNRTAYAATDYKYNDAQKFEDIKSGNLDIIVNFLSCSVRNMDNDKSRVEITATAEGIYIDDRWTVSTRLSTFIVSLKHYENGDLLTVEMKNDEIGVGPFFHRFEYSADVKSHIRDRLQQTLNNWIAHQPFFLQYRVKEEEIAGD